MEPGLSQRRPEGHPLGPPSRPWAPWGSRLLPWSPLPWESEDCHCQSPKGLWSSVCAENSSGLAGLTEPCLSDAT